MTGESLAVQMLEERGYLQGTRGENIAGKNVFASFSNTPLTVIANELVAKWMSSPGHKENILHSDYHATAVGIAMYPGGAQIVISQVFRQ